MRHLLAASLLCLAACSVTTEPTPSATTSDGGCPTLEAGPVPEPDAGRPDGAVDAGPSVLAILSVDPVVVSAGRTGGTLVTLRGSGFLRVQDVEVSVTSVPFTVLDDQRLTFYAPAPNVAPEDLPYRAEVDVIIRPADQVQTFITYVR